MDVTVSDMNPPRSGFAALSIGARLSLAAGLAALIAVVVAAVIVARTPDYKVLFANLSDKDGGAVIGALSQMNVPYKFSEVGGAILVPADRVHDARLKLASQGLPRGGTIGFELLETQKFGTTQFQERLNFQRALEGELARSIQSLAAVQSARVHLALPASSGFLREQQKPSASVLLTMHPGRVLDRGQVAGILHLVASSIPEMSPQQVSVVDQNGELLSNSAGAQAGGLDPSQIGYVRTLESSLSQRIVDILEAVVGAGNVRAQVSAEVDFTQTESTAEQYRPNQGGEPAAVRSQQSAESNSRDGAANAAAGIPGAMSNQPPAQATAPINGPAQQTQAAAQNGGAGGAANNSARRETVTNYEVDKTVRVTRNATGNIKRLSAAVLVNHRRTVDEAGKASLVALQPAELENLNALVKQTIGLNQERGDSLNVVNAPFTQVDPPKEIEIPLWKQPENISLAKEIGKQAGLVLLGLVIIFMVIRPALKTMNARPPAPLKVDRTVANDVALPLPGADGAAAIANGQEGILKLARDNPATVANVVRTWVNKEAAS